MYSFLLVGTSVLFLGGKDVFLCVFIGYVFFVVCVLCNPSSGMVCSLCF